MADPNLPPVLQLSELSYRWPGQAQPTLQLPALTIAQGERVFLYGPSGSGKSTLLALIGGLIAAQSGELTLLGHRLDRLPAAARDVLRANHLGIIFQQFNLLPYLAVLDNVCLPCYFSRPRARRAGQVNAEAERLLTAMDLPPALWRKRADQLSVGQQQRVAAARALIGQPALVLADEPTSALDSDRRQQFLDLLFAQLDAGRSALLFVSHDLSLAERFDRQLNLNDLNRAGLGAAA